MEAYAALARDSRSIGEELWNSARLSAYLRNGYGPPGVNIKACGFCDGLPAALACDSDGDDVIETPNYTYPSDPREPAPWYSEDDPDSADFAGLMILNIEGWETAQVSRTVIDRIGDGAVLGRSRLLPRTITVEALLIGRTCCSLKSGLRWLTYTLAQACAPCGGVELDFFECCPGSRCTTSPATSEDFDRHRRTLRNVGLTSGVVVTEKMGRSCGECGSCAYEKVEFTLTAGDPYSYGEILCPVVDQTIVGGTVTSCVKWTQDCADPCAAALCPATDPNCPTPEPPPSAPVPVVCGCDPLESVGSCVTINETLIPDFQEVVPIISIYAGSQPLRGIRVTIYNNPQQRPAEELDDCDACGQFGIGYLQADATITIDGRDRRFPVTCPGRSPANGSRLVSGVNGKAFSWPVLDSCATYTICVTADALTAAPDATFDVCIVPRSRA